MLTEEILKYFPVGYKGIIIEIGAGFPKMGNPVFGLREKGWQIISIEPNPVFCAEYEELKYNILNYACYSIDAGEMEFVVSTNGLSGSSLIVSGTYNSVKPDLKNEFNENTALGNGLSKNFDWNFFPRNGNTKTIMVEALTLNTILKKHYPELNNVDVIIIDVEGFELEVLKGIRFDKLKPALVISENIQCDYKQHEYMIEQGYVLNKRIDINDFYVRV